jgi:hypothetical protein
MTDYLNPDKLYPDDISRRIDTLPGFDSVRTAGGNMDIDGIKVAVTGDPYPGEIEGYVRRGQREHGNRLTAMEVTLDGGEVDIDYTLTAPFERIRRITGYLVGTTDRFNNAKQAEEHDRVKHGLEEK